MNNRMLPIGKLFDIEKGALQSTKCTPGDYDFITAAEEWKTHIEYTHECEALIFAAAASGSLGRTHYIDGKFTTSDLCYILTPKNDEKYPINLSFYHFVFNSLRPSLVAATKSGTSKESINQTNFRNYEIPYFDIELQDFWIEKLKNTLGLKDLLGSELNHQQSLLKKLRQQILQEAIEGKLTADWRAQNPDVEPASELLKRIAAEKAQLVKEKKIKAQKPMAAITDNEKTFELPEGWEWCRLGDVAEVKVGATPDRNNPEYWGGTIHWVSSGEVANNYISNTREKITHKALGESSARINPKGSVLVAMIGQGKTRGQTAILNIDAATNQNVCAIRPHDGIIPEIVWYFFLSRYEKTRSGASGGNQPALNGIKIRNTVFGLPSIAEANEIIQKLRDMECIINQIESQIIQNKTHADQLMQAVLKEAFSHNSEAAPSAKKGKTSADTPEVAGA